MATILEKFESYLKNKKAVSDNTLESYMRDATRYSEFLEAEGVAVADADSELIEKYVDILKSRGKSPATVTRTVASIRAFYQYLISEGLASSNPAKGVKLEKAEKKLPEILDDREIRLLLDMPENDAKGIRDKAMLEILYATGIRVSELMNLNISDVKYNSRNERGEIICRGTKSTRTIPMHPEAVRCIARYIESVRPTIATNESKEALFINLNGQRLTRQGFWKIVKNYAEAARIEKEITPHTLRHSFAMHLYQNGASLHDLQRMLGHADISSTQLYAAIDKRASFNDVYDRCHPMAHSH